MYFMYFRIVRVSKSTLFCIYEISKQKLPVGPILIVLIVPVLIQGVSFLSRQEVSMNVSEIL